MFLLVTYLCCWVIFFQVICHNLSQFQNMEVSCQLVTGPVYLAGETITCQVSVVNNAAITQVSVLWGSVLDCGSLGFLKSRFQVLAWASASLHCFCTVSDSKVGTAVLQMHSDGYVPYACNSLFTNLFQCWLLFYAGCHSWQGGHSEIQHLESTK